MIISISFIGLAVFLWWGLAYSELNLFAGAALLEAGAMIFLLVMKSIVKYGRDGG